MTTAEIINIALLALAAFFLLFALYYIVQGLTRRSARRAQLYEVGKQEIGQSMRGSFIRALLMAGIAGLLWLAWQVSPSRVDDPFANIVSPTAIVELSPTEAPTIVPEDEENPTADATEEQEEEQPTPVIDIEEPASPTSPVADSDAETVSDDAAPQGDPTGARVNAVNGLYLRAAPGGDVLELLDHEQALELMDGIESDDQYEWRQVKSAETEGWVVADFLLFEYE